MTGAHEAHGDVGRLEGDHAGHATDGADADLVDGHAAVRKSFGARDLLVRAQGKGVADAAFAHVRADLDPQVPAVGAAVAVRLDRTQLSGHALRQILLDELETDALALARVDLDDVLLDFPDGHRLEGKVLGVHGEEGFDLCLEAELDRAARVVREDVDATLLVTALVLGVQGRTDLELGAGTDGVAEAVGLPLSILVDEHLGDRAAAGRLDLLDHELSVAAGFDLESVVEHGALHRLPEVVLLGADLVEDARPVAEVEVPGGVLGEVALDFALVVVARVLVAALLVARVLGAIVVVSGLLAAVVTGAVVVVTGFIVAGFR